MKKKSKKNSTKESADGNRNVDRAVADFFDESIKQIRQISHRIKAGKAVDTEGAILRRRKSATVSTLPQTRERYAEKYPWVKLEEEWAICNSISMRSPHHLEGNFCISLAMAIYILDALKHTGRLKDALQYLNWEQDELDDFWIPDVFDPSYDDDVLRGMTFLIQKRDFSGKTMYAFNNEVTANRHEPVVYQKAKLTASLSYRDRFNAIMELVHPIYSERASKRFVEKQWEFLDLFFKQDAEYIKWEQKTGADADEAAENFYKCRTRVDQLSKERKRSAINLAMHKNPLLVKMPTIDDVSKDTFSYTGANPLASSPYEMELRRLDALTDECEYAENTAKAMVVKHQHFIWFSSSTSLLQYNEMIAYHGKAVSRRFATYTVADPYEMCFGYLCLLENGNDMAWLYQSVIAVLSAAVSKLPWIANDELSNPWGEDEDDEYDDIEWTDETYEDDRKFSFVPKDYITKRRGLYALKYNDSVICPRHIGPSLKKINLPQVIYATTNMLMPRDMFEVSDLEKEFIDAGVPKDNAPYLAQYARLADGIQYRTQNWNRFASSEEDHTAEETGSAADESSTEDLQKQIKLLKKKNDELRNALHDADKKVRDAVEESKTTIDATKNEHQELLDLRELVFSLATGEEPESKPIADVALPFHTTRNIVVFGGHATWLKAIQPMLPEVNFIERDAQIGADLIRHADVVWIQSNAIAHAFFYKIIKVVRNHDVPLRYFGFASAEKCARQLIAVEKEIAEARDK